MVFFFAQFPFSFVELSRLSVSPLLPLLFCFFFSPLKLTLLPFLLFSFSSLPSYGLSPFCSLFFILFGSLLQPPFFGLSFFLFFFGSLPQPPFFGSVSFRFFTLPTALSSLFSSPLRFLSFQNSLALSLFFLFRSFFFPLVSPFSFLFSFSVSQPWFLYPSASPCPVFIFCITSKSPGIWLKKIKENATLQLCMLASSSWFSWKSWSFPHLVCPVSLLPFTSFINLGFGLPHFASFSYPVPASPLASFIFYFILHVYHAAS